MGGVPERIGALSTLVGSGFEPWPTAWQVSGLSIAPLLKLKTVRFFINLSFFFFLPTKQLCRNRFDHWRPGVQPALHSPGEQLLGSAASLTSNFYQ